MNRHGRTFLYFLLYFLMAWFLFYRFHLTGIFRDIIAPGDSYDFYYPSKVFAGRFTLWNDLINTGSPAVADPQFQTFYPPSIFIFRILPKPLAYNFFIILHQALAGLFAFLYMRELKRTDVAAFLTGVIFAFSGFLMSHKGHLTMVESAVWLPLILACVENYAATHRLFSLACGIAACSLSILAGYPQISIYTFMVALAYVLFISRIGRDLRLVEAGLFLLCFGTLLSAVQILPTLEAIPLTTRQSIPYSFFSAYSFSPWFLPLLIFPFLYGGGYNAHPLFDVGLTEISGYIGILPLFLAAFAFLALRKKDARIWFWSVLCLISFLLTLGKYTIVYRLLYHLPLFNLFRAPTRNWFEFHFAIAALAGYGLDYFVGIPDGGRRQLARMIGILAGACALLGILSCSILVFGFKWLVSFAEINQPKILQQISFRSPSLYVPFILIAASAFTLFWLYRFHGKSRSLVWIIVLVYFDLFSFGSFHDGILVDARQLATCDALRFLNSTNQTASDYRVLPVVRKSLPYTLLEPNLNLLHGVRTVNGQEDMVFNDYKELTGFDSSGDNWELPKLISGNSILSFLSTKYIVTRNPTLKDLLANSVANSAGLNESLLPPSDSWKMLCAQTGNGIVRLASAHEKKPCSLRIRILLENFTEYTIRFDVKSESKPDDTLTIEFLPHKSGSKRARVEPDEISNSFQTWQGVLRSGFESRGPAEIRIATASTIPIDLKNLVLQKRLPVFWGSNDHQKERNVHLYNWVFTTSNRIFIFENRNFLPRARFVEEILPFSGFDSAQEIIHNEDQIDYAKTALVELPSGGHKSAMKVSTGKILASSYSPQNIDFQIQTAGNSFLVLSDYFFPGWNAYMDGRKIPIYRVYGILRGVYIGPSGNHEIQFRFESTSLRLGIVITTLSLLILAAIFVIANIFNMRRSKSSQAQP